MAFILSAELDASEEPGEPWRRYQEYLKSIRDRFPPAAYALASSEWYHDFSDHRCPHDAWLEECVISEPSKGERNEIRSVSILVRLLGAYHDGIIELRYPQVFGYNLSLNASESHRDWRYDEFRLSERGTLVHEIEWCGAQDTGRWIIEASDVEFSWHPFTPPGPTRA